MQKIRTITVCGPTASGKTGLGVELALRLDGEIISADSMQIYKGMDIATAVVKSEETKGVPHHMISFLDVDESYSVSDYVKRAKSIIFDISLRGKVPIIVGGTGLYIDTLVNNINFLENSNNSKVRENLKERLENEGIEKLYTELCEIDFSAAEKIHPNNSVKVLRALEIYYSSGKTLSEQNDLSKNEESPFNNIFIGLSARERDFLYERINKRVDTMLEEGLVEEAKKYFLKNSCSTSSQAIGYKELKPYIDDELPLDECVENLKRATRRYAKRQLTWFRRNEKMNLFYIDDYNDVSELADEVMKIL